jgi:enterochelin esterase-like enzyme
MRFLCLFIGLVLSANNFAQTNRIISPEVLPDRRVTFRVQANKASDVALVADWMEPGSKEAMKRDGDAWSVTTGPMKPGVYIYTFNVDGITIADPANPQIKLRARGSASLLEVPSGGEIWEGRNVAHGTIEIVPHPSRVLNEPARQVWVYRPPGYDKDRSRRYPVLYLLHGSNDTPAGWTTVGRANFIMDNLLAAKNAREMIIVMPFGHAVPFDAPREQQAKNTELFSQYLLNDLMPMIESRYRVAKGRENRAIVGLSMGGGQSLHLGLGHLDLFSAVGAFSSGGIPRADDSRFRDLFDKPDELNRKLNLLWIGCGRQDPAFNGSKNFSALLDSKGVKHTFRELEGRHTFAVWRECFAEVAPQLFKK